MNVRLPVTLLALLLPACASAPPEPGTGSGAVLAYAPTQSVTGRYAFVDSSAFVVEGGAIGQIRATISAVGSAELTLAPQAGPLSARIRLTDFTGSFVNSAGGAPVSATEADVQGDAVLNITPAGDVTITSLPALTQSAQRVGVTGSFFRRFFVTLPARAVQRGALWVDTVRLVEDHGGTRATVHDVVTSTWVRDSTVAGRTLNVINTTTVRTLEIGGTSEGVEISQKLSGTGSGTFLWDPARSLVVERVELTELSGTFDLPGMGITGLPVTATGRGRLSLQP